MEEKQTDNNHTEIENKGMPIRYVALDTETTGKLTKDGDRIVEIGLVEIINNQIMDKMQFYLKPTDENGKIKSSHPEALKIHGLTDDFLKDKPQFKDILPKFLDFIRDSTLLIHNASFDIKFLIHELNLCDGGDLFKIIRNVRDTLNEDSRLFPEARSHSLNNICERFGIDTTNRTLHGALLDAELLAQCFIETNKRFNYDYLVDKIEANKWVRPNIKRLNTQGLKSINVTEEEVKEHLSIVSNLDKSAKTGSIYSHLNESKNTPTIRP